MYPSDDLVAGLARRLKDLRLGGLAGQKITQRQLGEALRASTPLISSWENTTNPKIPPPARLDAYATFFATERSVKGRKFRVLAPSELTDQEQARREDIFQNLAALRAKAVESTESPGTRRPSPLGGLWHFPPGQDVTIICTALPPELKQQMPYAHPDNPDFVRAYGFSDLDALLELYGHLRAANPVSEVNIRVSSELVTENYTAHLVVLGGVDWNRLTSELLQKIRLPVQQIARVGEGDIGGFTIADRQQVFTPEMSVKGGTTTLKSDVAHFYHGPSPFNSQRTVTICSGMFARGTLAAVRALTDRRLRDRNDAYVRERFGYPAGGFSILTRVSIVNDEAVPPDWTSPAVRLHEWQEEPRGAASDGAEPFSI